MSTYAIISQVHKRRGKEIRELYFLPVGTSVVLFSPHALHESLLISLQWAQWAWVFQMTANETGPLSFWGSSQPKQTKYHRCLISFILNAWHTIFPLGLCCLSYMRAPSAPAIELPEWQQDHEEERCDGEGSTQSLPPTCAVLPIPSYSWTQCRSNLLSLPLPTHHSPTTPSSRVYTVPNCNQDMRGTNTVK